MLEFVAGAEPGAVRYRSNGYGFTLPVVALTGSHDPFYYVIDKYYGASDHVVFIKSGNSRGHVHYMPDNVLPLLNGYP